MGDNGKNAVNDLINYKGIYFEDESGQKYQCPETGAHFEYLDMYRRLKKISNQRTKTDKQEGNHNDADPNSNSREEITKST